MRAEGAVSRKNALRGRLLAGAALLACAPLSAFAQTAPVPTPVGQTPPLAVQDGLAPDAIYIEADQAGRHLDMFGARADLLKQAARYVVDRQN